MWIQLIRTLKPAIYFNHTKLEEDFNQGLWLQILGVRSSRRKSFMKSSLKSDH